MKTRAIFFSIVLAISSFQISAQSEKPTLFKNIKATGGEIALGYTHIYYNNMEFPGYYFDFGVVLNNRYLLGLNYYGTVTSRLELPANTETVNPRYFLNVWGLVNEYKLNPNHIVEFAIRAPISLGHVSYVEKFTEGLAQNATLNQDYFLVFQPGLRMNVALFENFGIFAEASYRLVEGSGVAGSPQDLSGYNFSVGIRFSFVDLD